MFLVVSQPNVHFGFECPFFSMSNQAYCFYMFKNLIDIFIFLDSLVLMIGGLFKYLFLSFFPLLTYLCFIFVFNIFCVFSNGYF